MFLARIFPGASPQVYTMFGALHFPRAWQFVSYRRGAAAIGESSTAAVKMARRELERRPPLKSVRGQ